MNMNVIFKEIISLGAVRVKRFFANPSWANEREVFQEKGG